MDKILKIGLILILVSALVFGLVFYGPDIYNALTVTPPPPGVDTWLYTTGLTVTFKMMDTTTLALIDGTAGFTVRFYSISATPFGLISTDIPVGLAAYDTTNAVWLAVLNAGSYKILVYDGTTVFPYLSTVIVPGTNLTTRAVTLAPYMLSIAEASIPTIASVIYSYNPATGLYDSLETEIEDPGTTQRWQVTFTISAAGLLTEVAAGRIYLTSYTGLSITSATIDNVPVAVKLDTDGTDDGLTGPYVEYNAFAGGTEVRLNVVFTRTAALADGTYTVTMYLQYVNHNALLRWWTDPSDAITISDGVP